ncbi:MAG: DUF2934 domain-containing protein [Verrucomicrobiaceae bacterium]|nr:DUF2934 domain-containing protein [Verrucomicrobiaceae bacterium]
MSTKHATTPSTSSFDRIRTLAHQLWEQAGCPLGKDVHFWLAAEKQLHGKQREPAKASPAVPAGNGNGASKRRAQPAARKAAGVRSRPTT